MKPPSIVYNSDDASFPRYISWSERMTVKRRKEYNMELPDPAIAFSLQVQQQWTQTIVRIAGKKSLSPVTELQIECTLNWNYNKHLPWIQV